MYSPPPSSATRRASAIAGIFLFLSYVPVGFAQKTPFVDVPTGAYYEDAAAALLQSGALDRTTTLRPADLATRAELVKLLVNVHGTALLYPSVPSFNDVPRTSSSFPYFEAAANAGWVRGARNCYQQSRPCSANPADHVNRAEAATLLVRSFSMDRTGTAPVFPDNAQGQWYYDNIQTSADHCVLQGDDRTKMVRPAAFMNRAEMITMFYRASIDLQYGTDCGQPSSHITDVSVVAAAKIRLTFDTALDSARATDSSHYRVTTVSGGASLDVQSVTMLDSRTVDLMLAQSITSEASYDITARNLLTQNGVLFTDSTRVQLAVPAGHITNATAQSTRRIRLAFDIDLDTNRAADVSRFSLMRVSGAGTIGIQSITILNSKTIELFLAEDVTPNVSYLVTVSHLLTQAGTDFSESANVMLSSALTGHVTTVTPVASNRIDVSFDVDLDTLRSEESTRYSLTDSDHTVPILSAQLLTNRTVELFFGEAMQSQRSFTLDVRGMQATSGVIFSDSASFIYTVGSVNFQANLTGGQEVPSVTTSASGTGAFVLMTDGLHYDISVRSMSGSITSVNLRQAPSGQNGPVVFAIPFSASHATGVWSNITGDQRSLLYDGEIYVNVTTTARPNGEIRGQLLH